MHIIYNSNAIEGGTLTLEETSVILSKGLSAGGKSIMEQFQIVNHAKAWDWVLERSSHEGKLLGEEDVLMVHRILFTGIDTETAGAYRTQPALVKNSDVNLPEPDRVSKLMRDFMHWTHRAETLHPVELAAKVHFGLVSIHPFMHGNGREARLVMNMLLLQHGYPPALLLSSDRERYLKSLEDAQVKHENDDYYELIREAVGRSLDVSLDMLRDKKGPIIEEAQEAPPLSEFLRIGELSKQSGESAPTIRYWTKLGLLDVADKTDGGYQLYSPAMIHRIERIRDLQKQRYTLSEIASML